jgi:mercuric ion transport protein
MTTEHCDAEAGCGTLSEAQSSPPVPAESQSGAALRLTAIGGILGAIAASSCCIAPLVLFSLGISGAWIANLTALAPYQTYFIAATLAFLSYGYFLVYRRRAVACAEGAACSRPLPNHIVTGSLVLATVLVAGALGLDLIAPLLLTP